MLTSCSSDNDDNNVTPPNPGPLAEQLSGRWFEVYEATGTAVKEGSTNEKVNYSAVIDIYDFDKNGEGNFSRCFFSDDETSPVLVQGITGYGTFSYSSTADGKVSLTLKNDFKQPYPHVWSVKYTDGTITAKGVDDRELKLQHTTKTLDETLNSYLEQNGSKDRKHNAADYKPKGVDNSRWMKQLADNRLVADLSLPGSHDACTADGWYSNEVIAELMAQTQDLTISEQLKVGVRVFDVRPERNIENDGHYALRCSHGPMYTKLLVRDFLQILKQYLAANPTEFCILTTDLSVTTDKKAWAQEFDALINSSEFSSMFADFKPRLTVGEMRGHVLMLSKYEYAKKPRGGYCYGWTDALELEKQQQGHITCADGSEAPLWVQDYWGKWERTGKDEAVVRMLEAAAARDMTAKAPAWVINYPSAYFSLPFSDSYRENGVAANLVTINWLDSHKGSVGIIYMDFAGMDQTPCTNGDKLYATEGMKLVDRVIKQNMK